LLITADVALGAVEQPPFSSEATVIWVWNERHECQTLIIRVKQRMRMIDGNRVDIGFKMRKYWMAELRRTVILVDQSRV